MQALKRRRTIPSMEAIVRVADIMTKDVLLLGPEDSIQHAAARMRDDNIGSLPVASGDRLVGYVTDRDIVVRALADGRDITTPVREVMSERILYCFDDDELEDVAENMAKNQVRRLPVLTRDKKLCGIVSLGDLAVKGDDEAAEDALTEISVPER
jgi:CBS domain-containing protein